MRRRFWLAVARFAAPRAGDYIVKMYREATPEEDAAYAAEYAKVKWVQPSSTITTTIAGDTNVTWRYS